MIHGFAVSSRWFALAWLCLLVLLNCSGYAADTPAGSKPNIVFILADDLGINDLGCYGRKDHQTPHLDRLAAEGIRFTDAYAAASVCSPTRAALMTGLAPARVKITTFMPGRADAASQKLLQAKILNSLPKQLQTLPECLKEAGYATACIGKWHLGGKDSQPRDHGFDRFFPGKARTVPSETEGSKGETLLTDRACQFIAEKKEQPFFLYLAHHTPHIPYAARADRIEANRSAHEPAYAATIELLDASVGRVLAKLDELKLREKTLVIVSSDNGGLHVPELNHQRITHCTPFRAGKGFLYEGGIRVPLLVRWPGQIPAGRVCRTPVITTDWLPTLVEFAGATPPKRLDGTSLAGLLRGTQELPERALCWYQPHYVNQGGRPSGAIRVGRWKFIEHYDFPNIELYDLQTDPGEVTNVADKHPEIVNRLKQQLADWRREVNAEEMAPNPAFQEELFRKLYVEIDPSRYNSATASPEEFQRMQSWRALMDKVVRKE
jgi:arylsulfatase A